MKIVSPITALVVEHLPVRQTYEHFPKLFLPRTTALLLLTSIPLVLLILLPFGYVLIWAFKGTAFVGVLGSLSFRWVQAVFSDSDWIQSVLYSLAMALSVAIIGSLTLSVYFYSIRFLGKIFERLSFALLVLAILLPSVIYALALSTMGSSLGIPEYLLLGCGQLCVVLPIQYFVLDSSQDGISSEALFAGTTLGATHARNFWFVYIPQLHTPIWSAAVVGFFLAFDELVIASFVLQTGIPTVPKRLWDSVDTTNDPTPAVIAIVLFCLYILQMLLLVLLRRRFLAIRKRQ